MAWNNKSRQEILFEIKAGALLLQHNMSSHLLGEALYAQMEYDRLVEQFHAGHREWCSDEDYETAKRDLTPSSGCWIRPSSRVAANQTIRKKHEFAGTTRVSGADGSGLADQ
jgi:hypothetical protein